MLYYPINKANKKYSVQTVIKEYHELGGLKMIEIYFLQFWRLGSPRASNGQILGV